MENLLSKLRQETTAIHVELHEHPLLKSCQEGTMTRKDYVHLLKAFYAPWKILTPRIESVPIIAIRSKLLMRAEAIQNDLVALGVDQQITELGEKNDVYSQQELLGMCYVVIGSSMGAAVLSKSIKATFNENIPASYLSMTSKEAGWPELAAELRILDAKEYSEAPKAALDTFKLIHSELTTS